MQTTVTTRTDPTMMWRGAEPGRVRLGSAAHKALFTGMLRDTFNPYDPATIAWPALSEVERRRLASLPFWDIAVQTEASASARVLAYAETVADPEVRQVVELAGFEEGRHSRLFVHMAQAYGITLGPQVPLHRPRDLEWAFMLWGFAESLDSFFAFGLYEAAKRSGYLPPQLIEVFGPIVQEEARHIVFFRNWVAWRRRSMPRRQRPLFLVRILGVWAFIAWKRLQTLRNMSGSQSLTMSGFTETGHQSLGISLDPAKLIDLCFAEGERRLSGYDDRLLRPRIIPLLARFARRFMVKPRRQREAPATGS